jgi:uncharacterized protein YbjT (DUF2867 family)
MPGTAVIAGASGLTGSICLDYLLQSKDFHKVISLGRRQLPINHPKLKQIITDFSNLDETLSGIQADDFFCCLGTTMKKAGSKEAFMKVDYEYPVLLADYAKSTGAKGFHLVSAIGADKKSFFFYNRVKGMVEEEIMSLEFENTNIFRPSLLDGDRKENRAGEKIALIITKLLSPLMIGPLRRYRPTKAEAVGFAMVEMATKGIKGLSILEPEQIERIFKQRR